MYEYQSTFQDIVVGFLHKKMCNERYIEKKRGHNGNANDENIGDVTGDCDSPEEDIETLKATIVNDSNLPEIQRKLKSSLSWRSKLLENRELDLKEYFPYFFTNPSLVRKQYE